MTSLAEALAVLADGKLHPFTPAVEIAWRSGFAREVKVYPADVFRRPARLARITESGLRERARRAR